MRNDFYYGSREGYTQIHAMEWTTEGTPKAILQIAHGMVEFIERYDLFAQYLASKGIYVVGNDHIGHGLSVKDESHYGYFAEKGGNAVVLADINELRKITVEKYPNIPYFMLGHSMGSFLLRQYIEQNGSAIKGAIIMGTGTQPDLILNIAMSLCKSIAKKKGWDYRSEFIDNLAFGSYNKGFKPARTSKDWLTKDNAIVDAYLANPWDTFIFTLNGYYNMFFGIKNAQNKLNVSRMPKELPIMFMSGQDDPVGGQGKGVLKVKNQFLKAGMLDVDCKIYPNDRHEILNELDKYTVFDDIYDWLISKIK